MTVFCQTEPLFWPPSLFCFRKLINETETRIVSEPSKQSKTLSPPTVLVHYSLNKPLILSVDAGPDGVGLVLAHKMGAGLETPVAFASRTLTAAERKRSIS